MNRIIKFRAWDNSDKRMLAVVEPDEQGKREYYPFEIQIGFSHWRKEDIVLMQWTGLHDKNENEIYEGDVVKFHYFFQSLGENFGVVESEHELTGVIEWSGFGWGVSKIKGEHWRGYTGYEDGEGDSNLLQLMAMNESSIHEESFEVIGNIYQNPDLIKGG